MKSYRTNLAAILIAETLAIAGFALSMPVIPLYLQDLGIHNEDELNFWSGLIQSASAISLAVFAPIWGSLADSVGRRPMLLRAMFGGALVVGFISLTTAPWQVLALRTIQGCLTGTVAAATVLVAGISPAASIGFALGLLQAGVSTGNTLGPMIGGILSDFIGRRWVFLATSALLLVAALITTFFVEDDYRPRVKGQRPRLIPDFSLILSNPALLALMTVCFTLQAANSILTPILPLFIQRISPDLRLVGSSTGMVLGASAAASALAAAVMGRYSGRIGYGRTLMLSLVMGAILVIPQAFVANPFQLALWRAAQMLFLGGALPAVNVLIASRTDREHQGGIYGLTSSISSAGAALGPLIGSATAALVDYRTVFFVTSLMLALTILAVVRGTARTERTS